MNLQEMIEQATPLPWWLYLEPQGVKCNDGRELVVKHFIHSAAGGEHEGWPVADVYATVQNNQPANAALIIHAVNMLPKLIQALEKITEGSVGVLYPGMPGYEAYLIAKELLNEVNNPEVSK